MSVLNVIIVARFVAIWLSRLFTEMAHCSRAATLSCSLFMLSLRVTPSAVKDFTVLSAANSSSCNLRIIAVSSGGHAGQGDRVGS